nr:hypothetical protein [uncultured bacterium]
MIQPTEKPRNAGTTVQRPEIIGGTAASGVVTDKTPWNNSEYRLPGEDSFAAMHRWIQEHPGQPLPGRA